MNRLVDAEATAFEDVLSSQQLLQRLRDAPEGSDILVPQSRSLSRLTLTSRLLSPQAIFTIFAGSLSEAGLQDEAISNLLNQVYGSSYMLNHLLCSPMAYGLDFKDLRTSLPTPSSEAIARCQRRLYAELSVMISQDLESFEAKYIGKVINTVSEQRFLLSEALSSIPQTSTQDRNYSTKLMASIYLAPCYVPASVQKLCGSLVSSLTTYLERLQIDLIAYPYASSLLQHLSRLLSSQDSRQEASILSILLLHAVMTRTDFPLTGLPTGWISAAKGAVLEVCGP